MASVLRTVWLTSFLLFKFLRKHGNSFLMGEKRKAEKKMQWSELVYTLLMLKKYGKCRIAQYARERVDRG